MAPFTRSVVAVGVASITVLAAAGALGQTGRLDPNGHVLESSYLRLPLLGDDQKYAAIDGARMKDLVRAIMQISLANREDDTKYWGRIAGTRGEAMAREWVEARLRELDMVDIRHQEFDLPTQWFPRAYDITVEAAGKTYSFESLVPALRSHPTDGALELEVIWVGAGSTADFHGRDVSGKAVFIHSIPAPGSMGHSAGGTWEGAIRRAQDHGAAAIFVIYGISDNFTIWQGLGRDITVPGAFMGCEDGNVVKELIGAGGDVRVKMEVEIVGPRVLGQWFDGIRIYAAFASPTRSRRTWAGLR